MCVQWMSSLDSGLWLNFWSLKKILTTSNVCILKHFKDLWCSNNTFITQTNEWNGTFYCIITSSQQRWNTHPHKEAKVQEHNFKEFCTLFRKYKYGAKCILQAHNAYLVPASPDSKIWQKVQFSLTKYLKGQNQQIFKIFYKQNVPDFSLFCIEIV